MFSLGSSASAVWLVAAAGWPVPGVVWPVPGVVSPVPGVVSAVPGGICCNLEPCFGSGVLGSTCVSEPKLLWVCNLNVFAVDNRSGAAPSPGTKNPAAFGKCMAMGPEPTTQLLATNRFLEVRKKP